MDDAVIVLTYNPSDNLIAKAYSILSATKL